MPNSSSTDSILTAAADAVGADAWSETDDDSDDSDSDSDDNEGVAVRSSNGVVEALL